MGRVGSQTHNLTVSIGGRKSFHWGKCLHHIPHNHHKLCPLKQKLKYSSSAKLSFPSHTFSCVCVLCACAPTHLCMIQFGPFLLLPTRSHRLYIIMYGHNRQAVKKSRLMVRLHVVLLYVSVQNIGTYVYMSTKSMGPRKALTCSVL